MNNVQKEFEAWVQSKYAGFSLSKEKDGGYSIGWVNDMFSAWQSSRKNITVELPENCKGNTLTVDELKVMLDKVGIALK